METIQHNAVSPAVNEVEVRNDLFRRRLSAAQIDIVVTGLLCLLLFLFAGAFAANVNPLWKPTFVAIVILVGIELLTGITPGKWLSGLTLRRPDGTRPSVASFLVRGSIRTVPIALYLLTVFVHAQPANATLFFIAFLVGCSYVSVCYIMLMRQGITLFDAAARTRLARA